MAVSLVGPQIFKCVECDRDYEVQIDFYNHLKEHYEDCSTPMDESLNPDMMEENDSEESLGRVHIKKPSNVRKKIRKGKISNKDNSEMARKSTSLSEDNVSFKTRSGRVSKPRTRDDEVVSFSPKLKEEHSEDVEITEQEFDVKKLVTVLQSEQVEDGEEQDEIVEDKKPPAKKVKAPIKSSRKPKDSSVMLKKVETSRGVFKFECDICHKLYANSTSMTVHMRIHKGEKPFKCEQCDQSFRQYSDLMYHTASKHDEKKAFQCEFCGKEFSRKYSLTIHQKIHTGVRDYKCELCGKAFRASIYLQEHKRIHTGEKPYLCDLCGRGFRIKSDMHRHRLNVHIRNSRCPPVVKTKEDLEENYCDDGEEEIDVKDVVIEGDTTYVTISKEVDGEVVEDGTARRLLFISDNEAIIV